jgi:hypothetical protein
MILLSGATQGLSLGMKQGPFLRRIIGIRLAPTPFR